MSLNPDRLINLRPSGGGKHTAQCPACAASGADQKGKNHLIVYSSGAYGCAVDQSDEHSKVIYALAGTNGTGIITSWTGPVQPEIEVEKTWPVSTLERLIRDHSYWVKRGVREEVLPPLRGGLATEGQMKGRYVLPVFDSDGQIIGFAGRAIDPKVMPKWKNLGRVSKWIWSDEEAISDSETAILVEGAGCRLSLMSHGVFCAIPLWGVNISQAVIGHLVSLNPKDIIVATNNDEKHMVGQKAAIKIKEILDNFFDRGVVRIALPIKKDFLEMSKTEHDEWARKFVHKVEQNGCNMEHGT